jgi:type II secretory pathway predicted ATPase ExeA
MCLLTCHVAQCTVLLLVNKSVLALCMQVGLPMLMLVRDLIVQLHSEEVDAEAVILVFLPTYKTLELLHRLLLELAQQDTVEGEYAARCGRHVWVCQRPAKYDFCYFPNQVQLPATC